MKKLALAILLSITTPAYAYLPNGCYVADGTNYCHPFNFLASDCDGFISSFFKGNYMASTCNYVNEIESDRDVCMGGLMILGDQRNACYAQLNSVTDERDTYAVANTAIRNDRDACYAANNRGAKSLKKQTSLVAKLRKACGSKCNNIR